MVSLTIAEELLVGAWRFRIGLRGKTSECCLCCNNVLRIACHALYECAILAPAWTKLRNLREVVSLPPKLDTCDLALYGDLGVPQPRRLAQDE